MIRSIAYWKEATEIATVEYDLLKKRFRAMFRTLCRHCHYRIGSMCRVGYEPKGVRACLRNCPVCKPEWK